MSILELEEISAGYGMGPDILNRVSIRFEAGLIHCLIGPNGAGKSTLLRVIAGLLRPRSGRVLLEGKVISGLRPDQILAHGICLVPQDRSLFPDMTVRENLLMGGYIERDQRQVSRRIDEVLEIFPEVRRHLNHRAGTLSGGEQQMVAIARGLMIHPRVMMLDEPSLGLAPLVVDRIFEAISRLKTLGITVLIVEQNVRKGLVYADRGYVLDMGHLSFEGPAREVIEDPRLQELYLGRMVLSNREGQR
ncbi:High-affinity branched-chain amino acid transport ATP-binding protein LivF [Candidatus Thermoflexus japonica]|uniref:High-affinity branched-chain amino acid transport ATP-binding protein LivF n=1 Tax=Candidatus Thermoflexus japonica TaxID=2035417 RepID=A0A2H5Y656_9CHLR|nr:High-affinity branched-chain amino acid transport ATP-binding protein LivF [Candidatus Thermoflexus japonica]